MITFLFIRLDHSQSPEEAVTPRSAQSFGYLFWCLSIQGLAWDFKFCKPGPESPHSGGAMKQLQGKEWTELSKFSISFSAQVHWPGRLHTGHFPAKLGSACVPFQPCSQRQGIQAFMQSVFTQQKLWSLLFRISARQKILGQMLKHFYNSWDKTQQL